MKQTGVCSKFTSPPPSSLAPNRKYVPESKRYDVDAEMPGEPCLPWLEPTVRHGEVELGLGRGAVVHVHHAVLVDVLLGEVGERGSPGRTARVGQPALQPVVQDRVADGLRPRVRIPDLQQVPADDLGLAPHHHHAGVVGDQVGHAVVDRGDGDVKLALKDQNVLAVAVVSTSSQALPGDVDGEADPVRGAVRVVVRVDQRPAVHVRLAEGVALPGRTAAQAQLTPHRQAGQLEPDRCGESPGSGQRSTPTAAAAASDELKDTGGVHVLGEDGGVAALLALQRAQSHVALYPARHAARHRDDDAKDRLEPIGRVLGDGLKAELVCLAERPSARLARRRRLVMVEEPAAVHNLLGEILDWLVAAAVGQVEEAAPRRAAGH